MVLTNLDISLLVIYAVICIGIGIWSSRKQKADDYLIANRNLGTFAFVSTVVASYIGGAAIVAYIAYVYQFGISAIMVYLGTGVGYLFFIKYALKIRREGKKGDFHTMSDWFYKYFNKKVGFLSALIITIVFFGMLTNQFIAGTSILSSMSGLSYELALLISGIVILIYLTLGGFRSVVKTDAFQYLVLVVLFFIFGILMVGKTSVKPELLDPAGLGWSLSIAFLLYGIFTVFAAADIWQRVYAAKSDKVVKHGLIYSAIILVLIGFAITLIGLAAGTNFPNIDPNTATAMGLSVILPRAFLSFGLILIFAAIMSSADTIIFVLSTSIAKDYFGKFSSKKLTKDRLFKLTRIFIVLISILGMISAYFLRDIILVVLTLAGLSFALVPSIIGSFHWKLKNKAVFASLLSGLIYIALLLIFGFINPEASSATLIISTIVLIVGQYTFKR